MAEYQDLEAERAVLGALLLEGKLEDTGGLSPNDFTDYPHRLIFQAILELTKAGNPADLVTVSGLLREKDQLGLVGGSPGLATFSEQCPSASNLSYYAEKIRFLAGKRKIQTLLGTATSYPELSSGLDSISFSPLYREGTETESKPMQVLTLSDLLVFSLEVPEWLIEGILPARGLGILSGNPGLGKSWMLLDLAIEAARGGAWLGRFQTKKTTVLVIDQENDRANLAKRYKEVLAGKGLEHGGLEVHFLMAQGLSFNNQIAMGKFRAVLAQVKPSLVLIDSLIRVQTANENSASEMAVVFGAIKEIMAEFQCAMLFADHQRKQYGPFSQEAGGLLRGSTEKLAAVDTHLALSKKHRSGKLLVEHSKARFCKAVEPFIIEIKQPTPDQVVVQYEGEAKELEASESEEDAKEFITEALGADWKGRKDLVAQAREQKISTKAIDKALARLVEEGEAEKRTEKTGEGRGGKQSQYRLKQVEELDDPEIGGEQPEVPF